MKNQEAAGEPVLVTGGGGFLGGAIVERLVARGDRVSSFSRHRYARLTELGVRQLSGSVADYDAIRRAVRGVEVVYHTAARAGVWGPYRAYYQTNTVGTENVVRACRAEGVRRLVYTSSPSVVFDGASMAGVNEETPYPQRYEAAYPETKALAEQAVRRAAEEGIRTVSLRPHLIWGPGDNHLVPRIVARARRLRIVGEGRNRVDTIYIDNAADAHLLAADRLKERPELSGKVYFVSQGEPVVLWEMVNRILAAAGLPPVTRRISARRAYRLGWACEWVWRLLRLNGEPPMTRFVAGELATSHWFDIRAAREELGYRPQVSLEEGLQRLATWLRSERKSRDGFRGRG